MEAPAAANQLSVTSRRTATAGKVRAVLRWSLIAVFAWSSGGKLFWPSQFRTFFTQLGMFPPALVEPLTYGLPAAELLLALWLASGLARAGALLASLFVSVCFAGLHAFVLLTGAIVPCGCAGVSIRSDSTGGHAAVFILSVLCSAAAVFLLLFPKK